jgi:U3 small nucleolar RNA-associated protein 10
VLLLSDVVNVTELSSHQDSADMRGKHFVELARAIYAVANSCSTPQTLSTSLLKALFVNLREQALLFLAGVWTSSILSDMDSVNLPHAALFHGAAFLRAQVADVDHPHDFQGVLPSLLIALRSRQRTVRSAAMDCIAIISESSSSTTGSPTIYALDSVYGNSLSWSCVA